MRLCGVANGEEGRPWHEDLELYGSESANTPACERMVRKDFQEMISGRGFLGLPQRAYRLLAALTAIGAQCHSSSRTMQKKVVGHGTFRTSMGL